MPIEHEIKSLIRDIPDFPKPGIVFKDITPLLKSPELANKLVDELVAEFKDKVDVVAGIESRGFLFGMPLAMKLGVPFVPVRKKGKLPFRTIETSYDLEYGQASIELHTDALSKGDRVLLHDDLLATGGTARASKLLIEQLEAKLVSYSFIIELSFLNGAKKLGDIPVHSFVKYE